MRRADRLFEIVQILRVRAVTTAAWLAKELEVSERTIYRDVRDLMASGVPIDGEAGVGYALRRGYDLPPLMFTEQEIEALVLGARTVQAWGDAELERAATSGLRKIDSAVTEGLRERLRRSTLFCHNFQPSPETADNLPVLRPALNERRKLRFAYQRADGEHSRRTVRPLCLTFFGAQWLLTAWCEHRDAFRNFRVDRISNIEVLDETWIEAPGQGLDDFMALMRARSDD